MVGEISRSLRNTARSMEGSRASSVPPVECCIMRCRGMPEQQHPQVNPWIVAVAVMFATFMEVLDTTVVNVSLPHIAGSLSASVNEATWVLTSYLVANAII